MILIALGPIQIIRIVDKLKATGKFQIDKVELLDGSSPIPKIHKELRHSLKIDVLGTELNSINVLARGGLNRSLRQMQKEFRNRCSIRFTLCE
jgi:hypothetical protein